MTNRILISAVTALALNAWDGAAKAQQPTSEQERAAELAAMAGADAVRIMKELAAIDYRVTEIRRSFLGRIRIIAENDEFRREIVISSSTGEIKRDTVEARVGDAQHRNGAVGGGNANGGGNVKTFGGSGNGNGNFGGGNGNSSGGNGNSGGGNGNSGGGNGNSGGGNGGNGKGK